MQELEAALTREMNRLKPEQLVKVVRSVNDIKRIVAEFDPALNRTYEPIPVKTTVNVAGANQQTTYHLQTQTQTKSKRDRILSSLDLISKKIDLANSDGETVLINGRSVKPLKIDGVDCVSVVDRLIRDWFGGYRDGILICWDLPDGYTYRYDITNHRLTRINNVKHT